MDQSIAARGLFLTSKMFFFSFSILTEALFGQHSNITLVDFEMCSESL
jgi:hypothetical protein